MVVQTPPPTRSSRPEPSRPAADVIKDARERHKRHRRAGAFLSLMIAAGVLIATLSTGGAGGGGRHNPPSVATGHEATAHAVALRLPRGPSRTRFTIIAPANRPYDVIMSAPAGTSLVLTMRLNYAAGWSIALPKDPSCTTTAGQTRCALHFAAGGNPGGQWTGTLRKTTRPAARASVNVVFSARTGDVRS